MRMTFLELQNYFKQKYQDLIKDNVHVFYELIFFHSKTVSNTTDLVTFRNQDIDFDFAKFQTDFIDFFQNQKPLEYITNKAQFMNLDFEVNEHVLIPRMETELVFKKFIDHVLKTDYANKVFLDLCTGSGCLAIALAKQFQNNQIYGSDIDPNSLKVAYKNKELHNVINLTLIEADFLEVINKINQPIDYVICNPPYIDINDKDIQESVSKYEPHQALFASDQGLKFYKDFVNYILSSNWKPQVCVFEFGYQQKQPVVQIFEQLQSLYDISCFQDGNNLDRGISIIRK